MNELYRWICNLNIYPFTLWYILHFSKSMFLLAIPQPGLYHKTKEYSDEGCSLQKTTGRIDRKMVELKCPIKEKDDRIALNKGPRISTKEKRRAEKAKSRGPQVSHQRHHCLTWGEYINVFFVSTSKNIVLFCSASFTFDQFNVCLLIMLLYCHKILDYINKDHSFHQSSVQ